MKRLFPIGCSIILVLMLIVPGSARSDDACWTQRTSLMLDQSGLTDDMLTTLSSLSSSHEKVQTLLLFLKQHAVWLPVLEANEGCQSRAQALSVILDAIGLENEKIYAHKDAFIEMFDVSLDGESMQWRYHVAVRIQLDKDGPMYVMDHAFDPPLLLESTWKEQLQGATEEALTFVVGNKYSHVEKQYANTRFPMGVLRNPTSWDCYLLHSTIENLQP